MDSKNTLTQHLIVGSFTLALILILKLSIDISWAKAFARTSFILLFITLTIGPVIRLKKLSTNLSYLSSPLVWRGELGIWFTLTALIHFIILLVTRSFSSLISIGGGGYGLANFLGLIALIWALLLTATSFRKAIVFLGATSWHWLHSLVYVIFYLATTHIIYFQFFSTFGEVGPDWYGYATALMTITVISLQLAAFSSTVAKQKAPK